MNSRSPVIALILACALANTAGAQPAGTLGLFSDQSDVGIVRRAGEAQFDAARGVYAVSGSGANMWFTNDAFHFVWKRVSGDLSLTADVRFLDTNGVAHRKACLLIRQSLDPDSAYADAARHGNGLTSLQFREQNGATTGEIQSGVSAPSRLGLEKRGDYVTLSVAGDGQALRPAGAAFRLRLRDPFYVGLGVCSHDADAVTKAEFADVQITTLPPASGSPASGASTLEVVPIGSKDRRIIYTTTDPIEALQWSNDGKFFTFNNRAGLYKLPVAGGQPEWIDASAAQNSVPTAPGLEDSPKNSPNGQFIYFSSIRGGLMQIWRKKTDGTGQELLTSDDNNNWFPHPSPDGKWIVFLTYGKEVKGHPANQDVMLRLVPAVGGRIEILAKFFGGDGALNAPSWSPDSKEVAYVSHLPRYR